MASPTSPHWSIDVVIVGKKSACYSVRLTLIYILSRVYDLGPNLSFLKIQPEWWRSVAAEGMRNAAVVAGKSVHIRVESLWYISLSHTPCLSVSFSLLLTRPSLARSLSISSPDFESLSLKAGRIGRHDATLEFTVKNTSGSVGRLRTLFILGCFF